MPLSSESGRWLDRSTSSFASNQWTCSSSPKRWVRTHCQAAGCPPEPIRCETLRSFDPFQGPTTNETNQAAGRYRLNGSDTASALGPCWLTIRQLPLTDGRGE